MYRDKILKAKVDYYESHRVHYARIKQYIEYLDYLYLSGEDWIEFESVLNDLIVKFDNLTFNHVNR